MTWMLETIYTIGIDIVPAFIKVIILCVLEVHCPEAVHWPLSEALKVLPKWVIFALAIDAFPTHTECALSTQTMSACAR